MYDGGCLVVQISCEPHAKEPLQPGYYPETKAVGATAFRLVAASRKRT